MKVLDSDACIGTLRGRSEALERRGAEVDEVAATGVTASELFHGAAKSATPDANAALVVRRGKGPRERTVKDEPIVALPVRNDLEEPGVPTLILGQRP